MSTSAGMMSGGEEGFSEWVPSGEEGGFGGGDVKVGGVMLEEKEGRGTGTAEAEM